MPCDSETSQWMRVASAFRHLLGADCMAVIVEQSFDLPSELECGHPPTDTLLAGSLNPSGLPRVLHAALGSVTRPGCDEHAVGLAELLAAVTYLLPSGEYAIATWEDGGSYPCQEDGCEPEPTLEQMLRGAFIRQENGVARVHVAPTVEPTSVAVECGAEPIGTLLRRAMIKIAPGEYAIRVEFT